LFYVHQFIIHCNSKSCISHEHLEIVYEGCVQSEDLLTLFGMYILVKMIVSGILLCGFRIIIIIMDLYSAFRSEDTEVLDAAQED